MAGIKIPISADFDSGDLDKVVQQFSVQMNRLAKSIAEANDIEFSPIDTSTVDDIKKVHQQFEALKRLSESFNKRLKDTGQSNFNLFEIDFHKLYENQRAGARKALDVLQYVTAGTTLSSRIPRSTADNLGSQQLPQKISGSPATSGWKQMGGNVFHSAMGAAGPVGQVVGGAVNAGMSSGLKAGLFGLAGGFAALGIGKLVSSAREKVDDVRQEYIGYDHLKRALGDVNVGFDDLKDSLRFASDNIFETYSKGQELAAEFAKISGLSRDQSRNLFKEVAISGGFSRSFGSDTKQSNQFFAQMRQFKVTGNDSDTRRMALMIGEGIARSRAFSKTDELMQAIAGYTANQARMNLIVPNVEGYTGMLAGMVKSDIPGLDPQGSAALLGRVNAAIASGGGAGEAGQNFMYMALGNRLGLNPIETKYLQEGGMFSTGSGTFRSGLYQSWARKYGISMPEAVHSNATNFELIMGDLDKNYHNPHLRLDAMSRLFGVNISQAMALDQINKEDVDGMSSRLDRIGKNINEVSANGISTLANIEAGDMKVLGGIITDLRGRSGDDKLTEKELALLNKAVYSANAGGDIDGLRDVLAELSVTREMQHTEGSKTRQLIAETNNRLQDVASTLVEPLDAIKEGVLHLAGLVGFDRKAYEDERVVQGWIDKIKKGLQSSPGTTIAGEPLLDENLGRLFDPDQGMEQFRYWGRVGARAVVAPPLRQGIYAASHAGTASEVKMHPDVRRRMDDVLSSLPDEDAQRYRNDPMFLAMIAQESGWRHYDKNGELLKSSAGAIGIAQVMPNTSKNPGYGVKPMQNDSIAEHLRFGYEYKQAMGREFGGDMRKVMAAYNWGPGNVKKYGDDWEKYAPAETRQHVPNITSAVGMNPLPDGHDKRFANQSSEAKVSLHVTGTMNDSGGRPLGPIEAPVTRLKLPTANGIH